MTKSKIAKYLFIPSRMWNNRKIAFVSILIATSVSFILIFNAILPVTALPPFKLMAGGLPIKITGYIFGPIIGGLTGAISDLISFMARPTYYHFYFTLAWIAAGVIPGVVGYFMNKRWKKNAPVVEAKDEKHSIVNFIVTIVLLAIIFIGIFLWLFFVSDAKFQNASKIITNKTIFMVIALAGIGSMLLATIVFRFVLKAKTFNALLPIIVFTALLEVINTPLLGLGDIGTTMPGADLITTMTSHLLFSAFKVWGNMVIILIAYRVVSPLIYNKTKNGWN